MAVLSRRASGIWLCAAALCLAASCASWRTGGPRRFAFAHDLHVVREGLDCLNCHPDAGRADAPAMPEPDSCAVCHDELDADKPADRRALSLFDGPTFRAAHRVELGPERVFSHARHVQALQDCAPCHAAVSASADVLDAPPVTMDDCTGCHAQREVANECSTCHATIRAELAPDSHVHNWTRAHGQVVRRESAATADRCALCHQESTCVECHRSEPPRSHDVHWHLRGHGIAAAIDRQSCATCHLPDSCEQCHREAVPQSHKASWGAPRDTHCFGCHYPLQNEGCVVCHPGTPSHAQAPPKPDDPVHRRGMDCRQCHGVGAPLPHADNGDDCNACHH